MLIRIFFLLLLLSPTSIMAQVKRNYTMEELERLSHDSIASLAEKRIVGKSFDRRYFDVVRIKKNGGGGNERFVVTFKPSVIYLSRRHLFYSSVTVDLISGSLSHTIESKGKKYKWEALYYKPDREAKKVIRFVSKSAERDGEVERPDKGTKSISIVIHERFLYYQVEIHSFTTYGYYRVNRITGKVYHKGHKHKAVQYETEE